MWILYLKQGWELIKQHRFYTSVYVLGTGLAITMVMVMAIVYHIRTANIAPESNRDKMLIVKVAYAKLLDNSGFYNGGLSYQTLKECYYSLQNSRVVAAGVNSDNLRGTASDFYISVSGSETAYKGSVYCTDAAFFQAFNYSFVTGRPYSEEEFQSGMCCVVLSEKLAYKLFNANDILNNTLLINDIEYIVTGVVKDVSPVFTNAYAEFWIPYSSIPYIKDFNGGGGIVGLFSAFILADNKVDYPLIKKEIEQNINKYNTSIADWEYQIRDNFLRNIFQSELSKHYYLIDIEALIIRYCIIAFVFLLVPVINLSGVTSSRMQERVSELGIRKAFGATQGALVNQILTENLTLTLLGGIMGLILSFLIVFFMKNLLFDLDLYSLSTPEISLSFFMLFNMQIFGYALGICLLLNVLSSYVPVWNVARRSIVQSINDKYS